MGQNALNRRKTPHLYEENIQVCVRKRYTRDGGLYIWSASVQVVAVLFETVDITAVPLVLTPEPDVLVVLKRTEKVNIEKSVERYLFSPEIEINIHPLLIFGPVRHIALPQGAHMWCKQALVKIPRNTLEVTVGETQINLDRRELVSNHFCYQIIL